jgi:tetratricopeptide (TPR) repeat protein
MREELTSLIHRRVSDSLEKALEYFDSRRFELAAETFNSILTLEPTNAIAVRYLERIQKEQKLGREQLASLNVSAASAYALGDFDTAIRIWEQILAIDSTFTNVQRNLERAKNKKALLGEP